MRQLISAIWSQISCLQPSFWPKRPRLCAWSAAISKALRATPRPEPPRIDALEVEHAEHDPEALPRRAQQMIGRHPATAKLDFADDAAAPAHERVAARKGLSPASRGHDHRGHAPFRRAARSLMP